MNYNRDYIVVDHSKKLFGLNDLGMTRVKMNKVSTKKDKTIDTWDNNTEWLDADGVVYSMMNRVPGARLSWNKERINMHELVKIGLFRSIFRVTDFNLTNVLGDEDGNLWSIDEHQIGVKKNIFGRKCGWVKNITKEIVDDVLKDLMEKEDQEMLVLQVYLPEQVSEEVLRKRIQEVIAETGAEGMKDFGRIMKVLVPEFKGKADNALIKDLAGEFLN